MDPIKQTRVHMNNMNLIHEGIDLNLLTTLDVLLAERSVTRAARSQGVTQSAMSHRLKQLRTLFRDELLVRSPEGLILTDRARALREPLRVALDGMRQLVNHDGPFDPKVSQTRFVLGGGDYSEMLMLPRMMDALARVAPRIELRLGVLPSGEDSIVDALARGGSRGGLDLAVAGPVLEPHVSLRVLKLPSDPFVVIARRSHPRVRQSLSLRRFFGRAAHTYYTEWSSRWHR